MGLGVMILAIIVVPWFSIVRRHKAHLNNLGQWFNTIDASQIELSVARICAGVPAQPE